jgi:hypothetical protein
MGRLQRRPHDLPPLHLQTTAMNILFLANCFLVVMGLWMACASTWLAVKMGGPGWFIASGAIPCGIFMILVGLN